MPSCNTRRMVETAAHLTDHVLPRLPVRQWVLSVPRRLRYFMQRDGAVLNMVLRTFLRGITQTPQTHSPGARSMGSLRKWRWRARARAMPNPHHRETSFTRPVLSTRPL
jgi:hypothetical protein